MAARPVLRFADWRLRFDVTGSPPIFEMECTSCDTSSEASEAPAVPQEWAMKHAGRTGHTMFRAVNTSFFRATQVKEER
ncbi:DUF7848 domain-containing protein [Streptomyces sp. NPDC001719]